MTQEAAQSLHRLVCQALATGPPRARREGQGEARPRPCPQRVCGLEEGTEVETPQCVFTRKLKKEGSEVRRDKRTR